MSGFWRFCSNAVDKLANFGPIWVLLFLSMLLIVVAATIVRTMGVLYVVAAFLAAIDVLGACFYYWDSALKVRREEVLFFRAGQEGQERMQKHRARLTAGAAPRRRGDGPLDRIFAHDKRETFFTDEG